MDLYLMRHAAARRRESWAGPDEARPLTERGRAAARAVLRAAAATHDCRPEAVWTSPYLRARQTAELAAEILRAPLVECPALSCGTGVGPLRQAWARGGEPRRLMLVGHEPDLGEILATLLGERDPRPLKKGAISACTGRFAKGQMTLSWELRPRDVPSRVPPTA